MTRPRPFPFRKIRRALEKLGYEVAGQRGSHVHFRHSDGRFTQVPNHAREEVGKGLLKEIIESTGLTVEEFFELV